MGRAVFCIVSSNQQLQEILDELVNDGFAHCEIAVLYPRILTDPPRDTGNREFRPGFKDLNPGWFWYRTDQEAPEFELPGLEPLFAAGPGAVAHAVDVTSSDSMAEILEGFPMRTASSASK